MSDFEYRCLDCNTIYDYTEKTCPECGSKRHTVYSMDGITSTEQRRIDRYDSCTKGVDDDE